MQEITIQSATQLLNLGLAGVIVIAFLYSIYWLANRVVKLLNSKDEKYTEAVKAFTQATVESTKAVVQNTEVLDHILTIITKNQLNYEETTISRQEER